MSNWINAKTNPPQSGMIVKKWNNGAVWAEAALYSRLLVNDLVKAGLVPDNFDDIKYLLKLD